MKVVVALGGNAMLRRGEALTAENQIRNIKVAAKSLAKIAEKHELILTHGNGPQVGLLALQGAAYKPEESYPLDVLVAETQGMIGYLIQQELMRLLPERKFATLLTQVEVDPKDKAFEDYTKFIGPVYDKEEADKLVAERGITVKPDGDKYRQVVPSPEPKEILELDAAKALLDQKICVIFSGGGGIPVMKDTENGGYKGLEAVIDKDRAAAVLAQKLGADALLILTDVPAVVDGWGTDNARSLKAASPEGIASMDFAAGSMGPKVEGVVRFVEKTGGLAGIGRLEDALEVLEEKAGTVFKKQVDGDIQFYE